MPNTALNRTTQALLTNKSGGALVYGDVVVLDNTNANGFTTTTTAGLSTRQLGVILEPNGIANNASGMVALGAWCPKVNLNTAATVGQFIKTHTVAGQATPHSSPQVEGDFGVALDASATPSAILFGSPNGPSAGGAGTVTNTGALTSGTLIQGNGGVDVTLNATTATVTKLTAGVPSAASPGTDYVAPLGVGSVKVVPKTGDESVTSSTALQDDDELLFAMGTSQTWLVELMLLPISASNNTGNIKLFFTLPASGAVLSWGAIGNLSSVSGSTDMTTVRGYGEVAAVTATAWVVNSVIIPLPMYALVTTAGTSGNFTLQWAQNSSNINATTIKAGSWLKATRVA